jgi:uncharacterized protein (TIGR02285 family)
LNPFSPQSITVLFISIVFLISATYSAPAISDHEHETANKKRITWLVEDKLENINLLAKTSPETSTASYIENLIIQRLTHYNVKIERLTASRISRTLATKDNACVANRLNTKKRREYSLFSDPQSFYLTHKLYRFNQKSALPEHLFNEKGEIKNLPSIFKALPEKNIGIAQGISFGNFLDKQIKQIEPTNIYYRGGNQRVVALASMLYRSRVDLLLALPVDITPNKAQKPLLEQYTIAGAPPYLIAHFNCSKSELGQNIIDDINKILAQVYKTEDYYQAHKRWFSNEQLSGLQTYLAERFSEKSFIRTTQ